MNSQSLPFTRMGLLATAMITAAIPAANAEEWIFDGDNGLWTDTTKWNPASVPNAIDAIADFSTLDITNHRSVIVEAPHTVGSLLLGDTNNNRIYRFEEGTAGTLTFDVTAGNATISNAGTQANEFKLPIVLNDTLEITGGGTINLWNGCEISGSGGIIYNGTGTLAMRGSNFAGQYSYTGPTVVNSGVYLASHEHNGNLAPGNLQINEARYQGYYNSTLNRPLGTGNGEFQLTGGTAAGFNYNNSQTINFNNDGSLVTWGSPTFDPGTLLLGNTRTSGGNSGNFHNALDLNNAARTFHVTAGHPNLLWNLNGVISDSGGSGSVIVTGNGLLAMNAVNTYTGDTNVNGGTLQLKHQNAFAGDINFNTGSTLNVPFGGANNYTPDAAGVGSLGALVAGTDGNGNTVNYTGDVTLRVGQTNSDISIAAAIPNMGSNLTLSIQGNKEVTLTGQSTFTGSTTVGTTQTGFHGTKFALGADNALPAGAPLNLLGRDHRVAMDMKGFDQEVGPLYVAGGQGWALTEIVDTVGGSVLTLSGGATAFDVNNNQVLISVDTVDLAGAEQTFDIPNETTISSTIQNGSLTKTGNNQLILSGANTYTGETKVSAGTLQTTSTTCLADASEVRMDGGVMNLNFAGTDVIAELYIGGVAQGAGTYDAISNPGQFTGTGSLTVGAVATPPFETWAGGTGAGLGFDEDKNNDGVDNGMAFLLGAANPDVDANDKLPTATEDGSGGLVMTFQMLDSATRGTAALNVLHSGDLGSTDAWAPVAPDPLALVPDTGTGVTVGGVDFTVTGSGTLDVTATIPSAGNAIGGKLFGRLNATE